MALAAGVLLVASAARAADQDEPGKAPSVLTADTVVYDSEHKIVTATGDVEISTGQRRLLADEVRWDQGTAKVFATGNVVQIEPSGDALFSDEIELDDQFREGFATGVGILLQDNSRIAATQGTRREGNLIELDRAVYSPCPLCDDGKGNPLWQIKARRVIYDQTAQTVSYRDARLEMFGLPIAYTPYFRHPAPGVKRQSGFLTPTFGTHLRTRRRGDHPLPFRARPEFRFYLFADLHPEREHCPDGRVPPPRQQRLHADRWRRHLRGVWRQREQRSRHAVSRLPQD